jgi:tRNA(adenine34) deaminase
MEKFMREALKEAQKARNLLEVPIGAVVVKDGTIIGRGHNKTENTKDPTAHAEMEAIREAAKFLGGWRLIGCDLYVTAEPCAMCAGAIVWSRIENLYIGTMDSKAGACGSVFNVVQEEKLNHNVSVHTGILQEQCSLILKNFFKDLRKTKEQKLEDIVL